MPDKRQSIRAAFLKATFSFLGYIASCDGQINREEVNRIKVHMKKMRLVELEQRQALHLFKSGTLPDFNPSQTITDFRKSTTPKLVQILLVHLITMARADGGLVEKELHALQWLARELGYKSIVLHHLLKMIYTQDQIALRNAPRSTEQQSIYSPPQKAAHRSSNETNNSIHQPGYQNTDLQNAYAILGVGAEMTEEEIRKTYKKLASQYHPDKLAGQGLTQEQLKAATERFKKILAAYEFIKRYRSMYA
ncbi:co-chaperone DjlA, partial [Cellvibrio sp.]